MATSSHLNRFRGQSIVIVRVGTDMAKQFAYGTANINNFINAGLDRSARMTVTAAKIRAPVYVTARYPEWAHMPHAHKVGGRLRRSIKKSNTVETKHTGRVRIYSNAYYSGPMEGGFRHVIAKRRIRGRRFFARAINGVFSKQFPIECNRAFLRAFGGA